MSGAMLGLVAFPEVRVHRQVVSDRVLPSGGRRPEVGEMLTGKNNGSF